jgi:hypothetical protein
VAKTASVASASSRQLIHELERQAGAWYRARLLQRYLRMFRRTIGAGAITGKLRDKKVDFLLWAEQYVDQLNPLSSTPDNPDQQHHGSGYWNSGEREPKDFFIRFFGFDAIQPPKLSALRDQAQSRRVRGHSTFRELPKPGVAGDEQYANEAKKLQGNRKTDIRRHRHRMIDRPGRFRSDVPGASEHHEQRDAAAQSRDTLGHRATTHRVPRLPYAGVPSHMRVSPPTRRAAHASIAHITGASKRGEHKLLAGAWVSRVAIDGHPGLARRRKA